MEWRGNQSKANRSGTMEKIIRDDGEARKWLEGSAQCLLFCLPPVLACLAASVTIDCVCKTYYHKLVRCCFFYDMPIYLFVMMMMMNSEIRVVYCVEWKSVLVEGEGLMCIYGE